MLTMTFRRAARLLSLASTLVLTATLGCTMGQIALTGAASTTDAAHGVTIAGAVHGGNQPISGATLQLYKAGAPGLPGTGSAIGAYGSGATALIVPGSMTDASANNFSPGGAPGCVYLTAGSNPNNCTALPQTDINGNYALTGDYTCNTGDQVYVVATGGNPSLSGIVNNPYIALMASLGSCPASGTLVGNVPLLVLTEVTTAATAAALQQFMAVPTTVAAASAYTSQGGATSGIAVNIGAPSGPVGGYAGINTPVIGLQNAFAMTRNLVGLATGTSELPDNNFATPWATKLNTIADILAYCINTDNTTSTNCATLMTDATPSGGIAAADTIQAALYMMKNPGNNIAALFAHVAGSGAPFPALGTAPTDWAISVGLAPQLPSAGGVAITSTVQGVFDEYGHLWVLNGNTAGTAGSPTIGSVVELNADGSYLAGPFGNAASPYSVSGGYAGSGSPGTCATTTHTLTNQGTGPKSIAVDLSNVIWVVNGDEASCSSNSSTIKSVMRITGSSSPATGGTLTTGYIAAGTPYGLGVDASGNVYQASSSNKLYEYASGGSTVTNGYTSGSSPQYVVADNNPGGPFIWSYASKGLSSTCAAQGVLMQNKVNAPATITGEFANSISTSSTCTLGAGFAATTNIPTGIAVDRNNNLWVANPGSSSTGTTNTVTYFAVGNTGTIGGYTGISASVPAAGTQIGSSYVLTSATSAPGVGGVQVPFAVAVDGNNTVWVANSSSSTSPDAVSQLVATYDPTGANPITISNAVTGSTNGYTYTSTSGGFPQKGAKSIAIDPSGNVWILNANSTTPVGYVTVIVGQAAPVITPMALQVKANMIGQKP